MKQQIDVGLIERNKGQIEGVPPNPRIIKDAKFDLLVKSLKDDPELLDHRGLLVFPLNGRYITIGGNMRLEACKKLGLKTVPCEVLDPATTPEKLRAFLLKDNSSFGEWEWGDLWAMFDENEIALAGIDIPPIDMEEDEEPDAEEDDYQMPEPETIETNIKLGDLIEFKKGNITHRLLCGDSTRDTDVDKLMDGRQCDLTVTDPPYNVNYEGATADKLKIANDNMSDANFKAFLIAAFKQMNRAMKKGAAFYIYHADTEGYNFRVSIKEAGFQIRQCLVWVKNTMVMGRQDYQWKHEPILYGWKDGASHYFVDARNNTTVIEDRIDIKKLKKEEMQKLLEEIFADKTPTSVIHEDKPTRNDIHPTMKPVKLIGRNIKNSSKQGQIVLDLFAGSGTTIVACHQLNRNAYTMEFDPKYCQAIVDRMAELDPEIQLYINGEPAR